MLQKMVLPMQQNTSAHQSYMAVSFRQITISPNALSAIRQILDPPIFVLIQLYSIYYYSELLLKDTLNKGHNSFDLSVKDKFYD